MLNCPIYHNVTSIIELAFPVNVNTFLDLGYTVAQVYDTDGRSKIILCWKVIGKILLNSKYNIN